MNEELNLVEILKNVPVGTELYCSVIGECKLRKVELRESYPIQLQYKENNKMCLDECGRLYECKGECILFPSKEQRDWSKFEIPEVFKQDEPVMCSQGGKNWFLRYHTGKDNLVYIDGYKSEGTTGTTIFPYTIKVSEFDFINRCKKKK